MTGSFNQSDYWIDRHKRLVGDPRSVGNLAATVEQNRSGENEIVGVVARAASLLRPARSVIDVGCGYGRIARSYTNAGYDYLGVDISPDALHQAAGRNDAAARFVVGDLATWDTEERFDIVNVLYVFVHFVDDARWRSLLVRALSWVAPGGALLLADHFPQARDAHVVHAVSRPFADYEAVFAERGFTVDAKFARDLVALCPDWSLARHFRLARRA